MLKHILPLVPEHNVYSEVFFGGGSVFFAKEKVKNETINDKLDLVVTFFEQLKTNFANLQKRIDQTLYSRYHFNLASKIIKSTAERSKIDIAWAFWFISNFSYLNKIGGGLKFSKAINCEMPRSLNNKKNRFTDMLAERIKDTFIENREALIVLETRNASDAFHYIDPPYPGADMGHYKGYTNEYLGNLLQVCEKLKGKFMLSNYPNKIITEYAKKNDWLIKEIDFKNSGVRNNDRPKKEILLMNYRPIGQAKIWNN